MFRKCHILGFVGLAIFSVTFFAFPIAVYADSSDTSTWNFYQNPDQFTPGQTVLTSIVIKNTTGEKIDAISLTSDFPSSVLIHDAYANMNPSEVIGGLSNQDNGGDITPYYLSPNGNRVDFGAYSVPLNLPSGQTLVIQMAIDYGMPSILPVTSTWDIVMYHWVDQNTSHIYVPVGNLATVGTNDPHPSVKPLNWGVANQYGNALNSSGLASPDVVKGLLPPGPIDTLLTIPITLLQTIINVAGGDATTPSFELFGHTATLTNGNTFWNSLPPLVPTTVNTIMIFLLSFLWVKSVYHRLQRASQFNTHINDTWGPLA